MVCPTLTVVANDDPSGVFEALEEETVEAPVSFAEQTVGDEDALEFLPGEEDLQELLAETADLEEQDD